MKKLWVVTLLLSSIMQMYSQSYEYMNYDWKFKPENFTLTADETKYPVVVLSDKTFVEIVITSDNIFDINVSHTITMVNSDEAIEKNNKVYIAETRDVKYLKNKVRVINSKGEIIEMNDNDIKQATDEETKRTYKYYAVRGIDKGSIIEILQVKRSSSKINGQTYRMQGSDYIRNEVFELIYPSNLVMDVKCYNKLPNPTADTSLADKTKKIVTVANIIPIEKEIYSNYNANVMYLSYKLTGNNATRNYNINSFKSIGESYFERLYAEIDKKDAKELDKFIEKIVFDGKKKQDDSILTIENYIKSNVFVDDDLTVKEYKFTQIIKDKKTDDFGNTKLFAFVLDKFGIPYEIVLTNNRYNVPFDPKFENVTQLQDYLLYFPKTKKYLAPHDRMYRYPYFSDDNGHNYGLFIKKIDINGNVLTMTDKKFIDLPASEYTIDSLKINFDFSASTTNPAINCYSSFSGYDGLPFQAINDYLDTKQKEDVAKDLVKRYISETNLKINITNNETKYMSKKPYTIEFNTANGGLLQKNGEDILFKIGEAIGPQTEMYDEHPRQMPIEIEHPHQYFRLISVKLPKGYKVSNLEKLNMNVVLKDGEKEKCGFTSSYTLENGILTVIGKEYYNATAYPLSEYETFKKVINAAADFNKIIIVFTKE